MGTSSENDSTIKGHHNYETMLKILDKFIEKYLLCTKCHIPELVIFFKDKKLQAGCSACGNIQILDSVDRAGNYLSKNVPKNMN